MTEILDRIRASLVGLRMPRALEELDHAVRRLERGELSALEAIDGLLAEEHASREGRRIGVAGGREEGASIDHGGSPLADAASEQERDQVATRHESHKHMKSRDNYLT